MLQGVGFCIGQVAKLGRWGISTKSPLSQFAREGESDVGVRDLHWRIGGDVDGSLM